MSKTEGAAVRQAKIKAKTLARQTGESYVRILDEIARDSGYGTWKALKDANPPTIDGTSMKSGTGAPWIVRMTFPKSVENGSPYLPDWFDVDGQDIDTDPENGEIANGLLHSVPSAARWIDSRTIEYRAEHRHHALGILGCMPLRRLAKMKPMLEVGLENALDQVQIADLGRRKAPIKKARVRDDRQILFMGDWLEDPEWSYEPALASTVWDWLMANSGHASEIWEMTRELRKMLEGRPSAIATVDPRGGHVIALIHDRMPTDIGEALVGWEGCEGVEWRDMGELDFALQIHVTPESTSYLVQGLDFEFHAQEAVMSNDDHSQPLVTNKFSLWWRKGRTMMHTVPPILLGAKEADIGHGAHRLDRDVLDMMSSMRPLGEIPVGERPFMVDASRTRGAALMGDYPH